MEGEIGLYLWYEKHSIEINNTGNSYNGRYSKKIQIHYRKSEIDISHGRLEEFKPVIESLKEDDYLLKDL